MRTFHFAVAATGFLALLAVSGPAAAQSRVGNNNTITQNGTLNGGQLATAIGLSTAQNGVASIVSGREFQIGNSNTISQTGRVNGGQIAFATGGSVAQNGVASIITAR